MKSAGINQKNQLGAHLMVEDSLQIVQHSIQKLYSERAQYQQNVAAVFALQFTDSEAQMMIGMAQRDH